MSCLAFVLAVLCGVWTLSASAADGSGISSISNEFWLGLFFTILLSLVGVYVKGLESGFERRHKQAEDRLASIEFDHKQQHSAINLLSERVLREHPTKAETAEHREKVERELERLHDKFDELIRSVRR